MRLLTSLVVLSLSFLAACGGTKAAGVYELDKAEFKKSMLAAMPADAPKESAGMVEKMADDATGSIELKADNTFVAKMTMMGMPMDSAGTWKLDGETLTTVEKGKDGAPGKTETLKLAGNVLSKEMDEGGKKLKISFRRK